MSKSSEMFLEIQNELLNTRREVEEGELSDLDGLIKMRKAKVQAEKILETVKDFENDRLSEIAIEAEANGGKYCGYEIKSISGRKLYSFKGITQIEKLEFEKKNLEDKFKNAFEGFQKGIVQTTEEDGVRYWIDENSELQPFPTLNIGKSFLQIKEYKK